MASASDDFNRGDNASLGANWTEDDTAFAIVSNQVAISTGSITKYGSARYTGTTPATNDQTSQCDLISGTTNFYANFMAVRLSATPTGYACGFFNGDTFYLIACTGNNSETVIDSGGGTPSDSTTYSAADVTAEGTTITGNIDGNAFSGTNSTYSSGDWGILGYDNSGAAGGAWDNWSASDVGGATGRAQINPVKGPVHMRSPV